MSIKFFPSWSREFGDRLMQWIQIVTSNHSRKKKLNSIIITWLIWSCTFCSAEDEILFVLWHAPESCKERNHGLVWLFWVIYKLYSLNLNVYNFKQIITTSKVHVQYCESHYTQAVEDILCVWIALNKHKRDWKDFREVCKWRQSRLCITFGNSLWPQGLIIKQT